VLIQEKKSFQGERKRGIHVTRTNHAPSAERERNTPTLGEKKKKEEHPEKREKTKNSLNVKKETVLALEGGGRKIKGGQKRNPCKEVNFRLNGDQARQKTVITA